MRAAAAVRERPIIMSGPMVRAILDGEKRQTRRVVEFPRNASPENAVALSYDDRVAGFRASFPNGPESAFSLILGPRYEGQRLVCNLIGDIGISSLKCQHGAVGDQLWVRETLRLYDDHAWYFAADGAPIEMDEDDPRVPAMLSWAHHTERETCPSIYMPRWASRLSLEITGIRVERVQEIRTSDIEAEGISITNNHYGARNEYRDLWDSLNAKRGYAWDVNPWVWVIEFAKVAS